LISILFGIVIAFLIGEFAVRKLQLSKTWSTFEDSKRLMKYITTNKRIGFTRIPNSSFDAPRNIIYKSNGEGFRDRTHEKENKSRKIRIAFLGDSVTEGFGVEESDRYSSLIEKELNSKRDSFEILNFAVAGHATRDELEILKSNVLAYHPDFVFLQINLNDFSRNVRLLKIDSSSTLNSTLEDPEKMKALNNASWLQKHSALYLYVAETYNYRKFRTGKTNDISSYAKPVTVEEWSAIDSLLSDMSRTCATSNAHLIVSYLPLAAEVLIKNDSLGNLVNVPLQEFCKKNGIDYADVTIPFRKTSKPLELFLDDCHLSVEGNRVVSEIISYKLKSLFGN